jgi:hypothetical protein
LFTGELGGGTGAENDRARGRNLDIRVFNDIIERVDLAMEGVTEAIVEVDIEAAERTGVVAGVIVELLVNVLDFLSEDRVGGGGWTMGSATPRERRGDCEAAVGFRRCRPVGLR